jgi:hypothetical protein
MMESMKCTEIYLNNERWCVNYASDAQPTTHQGSVSGLPKETLHDINAVKCTSSVFHNSDVRYRYINFQYIFIQILLD